MISNISDTGYGNGAGGDAKKATVRYKGAVVELGRYAGGGFHWRAKGHSQDCGGAYPTSKYVGNDAACSEEAARIVRSFASCISVLQWSKEDSAELTLRVNAELKRLYLGEDQADLFGGAA